MLLKGSWRIARIAGVGVHIHWSFSLIGLWLLWYAVSGRRDLEVVLFLAVLVLLLFACVALHELGHALMARQLGMVVKEVIILPIGGLVQIQTLPEKPVTDFFIAVAGPLVNFVIATGAALLLFLFKQAGFFWGYIASPDTVMEALIRSGRHQDIFVASVLFLLVVNSLLFVFNLIPAFPMDGGRIVRALLATFLAYDRATRIARWLGQGIAVLLLVAAFAFNSFGLFLLGALVLVVGVSMKVGS